MKRLPLCLFVLLLFAGCNGQNGDTLLVTGQIEGITADAGSRIGGRVTEVLVTDGDPVKAGDVLLRLDSADAEAVAAAARAQVARLQAMHTKLENGATPEQLRQAQALEQGAEAQYQMAQKGSRIEEIKAAQAALEAAQVQRDLARTELARVDRLFKEQVATQQQLDKARTASEAAEAQLRGTREKADMVEKGARVEEIAMAKANFDRAAAALDEMRIGARPEDREAAQAAVDAANADLARAEVALSEMVVKAPMDGLVESVDLEPGDLLKPGAAVRIIDPKNLKLWIYVSAAMLGYLRLGEEITLTTDSFGAEEFKAKIVHIASQGEFTPRNLQTQEERVQQVFGVKLKLDSAGGKLRAGMTAMAHLPRRAGAQ
jgi:multidrug resistance efflux pump